MKKTENLKEIKTLSKSELKAKAASISEELMKLRFNHSVKQLTQTHRLGELKKNLARVRTLININ